jgi:hypothetical protein
MSKRKRPPESIHGPDWFGSDIWGATREDGTVDDGVVDTITVGEPDWPFHDIFGQFVFADAVRLKRIGNLNVKGVWR